MQRKKINHFNDWVNYPYSNMLYKQGIKPGLDMDMDQDGIVDWEDCDPFDVNEQGIWSRAKSYASRAVSRVRSAVSSASKSVSSTAGKVSSAVSSAVSSGARTSSSPSSSSSGGSSSGGGGGSVSIPGASTNNVLSTLLSQGTTPTATLPPSLTGKGTYDIKTQTYTSPTGQRSSMSIGSALKTGAGIALLTSSSVSSLQSSSIITPDIIKTPQLSQQQITNIATYQPSIAEIAKKDIPAPFEQMKYITTYGKPTITEKQLQDISTQTQDPSQMISVIPKEDPKYWVEGKSIINPQTGKKEYVLPSGVVIKPETKSGQDIATSLVESGYKGVDVARQYTQSVQEVYQLSKVYGEPGYKSKIDKKGGYEYTDFSGNTFYVDKYGKQIPLYSGGVSPVTTTDIMSIFGAGRAIKLGKYLTGAAILGREPISTEIGKIDTILEPADTGFALSGIPRQLLRGGLYAGALAIPGIATGFTASLVEQTLKDPLGMGKEFVEYARKNPYEVGFITGTKTVKKSARYLTGKQIPKIITIPKYPQIPRDVTLELLKTKKFIQGYEKELRSKQSYSILTGSPIKESIGKKILLPEYRISYKNKIYKIKNINNIDSIKINTKIIPIYEIINKGGKIITTGGQKVAYGTPVLGQMTAIGGEVFVESTRRNPVYWKNWFKNVKTYGLINTYKKYGFPKPKYSNWMLNEGDYYPKKSGENINTYYERLQRIANKSGKVIIADPPKTLAKFAQPEFEIVYLYPLDSSGKAIISRVKIGKDAYGRPVYKEFSKKLTIFERVGEKFKQRKINYKSYIEGITKKASLDTSTLMQIKYESIYGNKLKWFEGKWNKSDKSHFSNVERNLREIVKKYNLPYSENLIIAFAKMHDILKLRGLNITDEILVKKAIINGNLDKYNIIKRLTQQEKKLLALTIGKHHVTNPNLITNITLSNFIKAALNADRLDIVRYGKKVNMSKLFNIKTKTKLKIKPEIEIIKRNKIKWEKLTEKQKNKLSQKKSQYYSEYYYKSIPRESYMSYTLKRFGSIYKYKSSMQKQKYLGYPNINQIASYPQIMPISKISTYPIDVSYSNIIYPKTKIKGYSGHSGYSKPLKVPVTIQYPKPLKIPEISKIKKVPMIIARKTKIQEKTKKQYGPGYNVLSKPVGMKKFQLINRNPVTENKAKDIGAYYVSTNLARTFQVVKANKKAMDDFEFQFVPENYFNKVRNQLRNFRIKQGKAYAYKQQYIQKSKYMLGTSQEKRQIQMFRKRQANFQKQIQKGIM